MEWKWMCNICKKIVEDERELMMHVFFDHPEAIHYGTPIATDRLPIPQKPKGAAVKSKPKAKRRRTVIEEDEEELDEDFEKDLSLD